MKTNFRKAAWLAIALVFFLSSALYAAPYNERRPGRGYDEGASGGGYGDKGEKLEQLKEELGLTPEQEAKLKADREEFKAKNIELTEKLRAKRDELKNELEKAELDTAKVYTIISDIERLTGEKLRNRVNKIISMKSTLTPEQFEKLQAKMRQKIEKRMEQKHRRDGDKPRFWQR
ncbi:MAG: hypothetical protein COV72_01520 [Candidatus Omnitrophica bacterium CG11_big_fil_rev_8_21_14_0_20_42_13]|uniref:Periplasmic heavy metal sensor n=1 Tax=Candidatus Ghiorseimicrobium undicola TaxID=1974746 RepID=A0A2H0M1F7_9BACT|nr:MAG: hypothetical protein COV72_01520 [Candidatus Omnitrophica bacterium CG11_big_fil_rev_8_21_14_0_20_42_13]